MKIGAFSKKYNVSIDTVRHYMDMGLLYPPKINGQYDFNSFMCQQMEEIISLKDYGLTLGEIGHYMYYNRLNSLDSRDFSTDVMFFSSKLKRVRQQIKELEKYENNIVSRIDSFKDKVRDVITPLGVSVEDLQLLACPNCKSTLTLNASEIKDNQIFEGHLTCSCGCSLRIHNGIIINGDYNDKDLHATEFDIVDYINETPMTYYNILTLGLEWARNHFLEQLAPNQRILELGTGYGLFLRACHHHLSDDMVYICTDYLPGQLLYVKGLLEYFQPKGRKLFILGDYRNLPLKEKSIDIILDIAGTTIDVSPKPEHAFNNILPLWKDSGKLIQAHYLANHLSASTVIPKNRQQFFDKDTFLALLHNQNIHIEDWKESAPLPVGGKYEQVSTKEDQMYLCYFLGQNDKRK